MCFYFRDDDAGWNDDRLMKLLGLLSEHGMPIDMAVIPHELTPSLAREMNRRMAADAQRVRVHQHGFAHTNHEVSGRKCEFGPARDSLVQRGDIERGRGQLRAAFGNHLDPIFTPPWNRCTRSTCECLIDLGFEVLSRESRAAPFELPGLRETPIHVDWFAHRKGVRLSREELGESIAGIIRQQRKVGMMFHYAVMDDSEMSATSDFLLLLSRHPRIQFCSLLDAPAVENSRSS